MLKITISTIFLFILFVIPFNTKAVSLGTQLSGRILLDVERNGEAWYIYPEDNKRYFLGRPADAFKVMRELGLGISEYNFQKIAQAGLPAKGDLNLSKSLAGKIVLQVEKNGEAWYINPVDLKKYYLGRPVDAFKVMRELGLGITRENLAKVHKPGIDESINSYSKYEHKKITVKDDIYAVNLIEIDLKNPKLKIITDAATDYTCKTNCPAEALASFANGNNNGFAAINGSYFDTSANKKNYYFAPVYLASSNTLINADQTKYWTTGPLVAFDVNNKFYYFKDSRDFKDVETFEEKYKVKLQAAISNRPRLIEEGNNYLITWDMDNKQENIKSSRNALGYKNEKIYLIIVKNATLYNLAQVLKEMEMEYALNLDGGYSSALYYNDEYMVGPGRDIPNAIIFSEE
ncbi:phosphodiester glycosidase family protein [Candidatus Parcubacteria bacterium]|nr:phosphodiester glycosidase family protein [Candidatus Parcubacteria bacterium]